MRTENSSAGVQGRPSEEDVEERVAEAEERAAEAGDDAELWEQRWRRRVAAEKEGPEKVRAATAAAVGLIEIEID